MPLMARLSLAAKNLEAQIEQARAEVSRQEAAQAAHRAATEDIANKVKAINAVLARTNPDVRPW